MAAKSSCNTLVTNGFHLEDLPKLKDRVREAVRLHAQDNSYKDFPNEFDCSHCGDNHPLTAEELRDALFRGPGQTDFVATYNEYMAMINGVPASSVGVDYTNGVSGNSDVEISSVINPLEPKGEDPEDPDPVEEDITPDVRESEKLIFEGTGEDK